MATGRPAPTQDDVLGYFSTLSNWGRWGADDELGTLNHISDDVRLAAARSASPARPVARSTRSPHSDLSGLKSVRTSGGGADGRAGLAEVVG